MDFTHRSYLALGETADAGDFEIWVGIPHWSEKPALEGDPMPKFFSYGKKRDALKKAGRLCVLNK